MEELDLVYLSAAITATTVDTQTLLVAADVELPHKDTFLIPAGPHLQILAGGEVLLEPEVEAGDEIDIVVSLRADGTATLWVNRTEYTNLKVPIRIDSSWRNAN